MEDFLTGGRGKVKVAPTTITNDHRITSDQAQQLPSGDLHVAAATTPVANFHQALLFVSGETIVVQQHRLGNLSTQVLDLRAGRAFLVLAELQQLQLQEVLQY